MTKASAWPLILCLPLMLAGCSWFGGDEEEELEPTELLDFDETLDLDRDWSVSVGKGSEFLRLGLMPAGDGARVYAASYDGRVSAFAADSGKRIWRVDVDANVTAGPGLGDDMLVVITRDGIAVGLSAENGTELWRTDLEGEAVASPVIRNDVVVVHTIDGLLRGLSAFDGTVSWTIEYSTPALTLRGSAAPVAVGSLVICGFDNGRLVAASLLDGATEWETMLSPPTGRSDLERLADVDGYLAVVGQDIYAAGYQGRIAAVAAESGQILWSRELSSYAGVGAEWNTVYALTDEGELVAMQRRNGSDLWRQTALVRRDPTAPVAFHTSVVVGDFEGYLHFFDATTGEPVARRRVGKGYLSGAPVVIAGRLYVQSENGTLTAFAVPEPEGDDAD